MKKNLYKKKNKKVTNSLNFLFFLCKHMNLEVTFIENPRIKIINFPEGKTKIINHISYKTNLYRFLLRF